MDSIMSTSAILSQTTAMCYDSSLLSSVMEVVERNARLRERIALFEIGPVFHPAGEAALPDEPVRLAIAITGQRGTQELAGWRDAPAGFLRSQRNAGSAF